MNLVSKLVEYKYRHGLTSYLRLTAVASRRLPAMAWWDKLRILLTHTASRLSCTGSSHKSEQRPEPETEREARLSLDSDFAGISKSLNGIFSLQSLSSFASDTARSVRGLVHRSPVYSKAYIYFWYKFLHQFLKPILRDPYVGKNTCYSSFTEAVNTHRRYSVCRSGRSGCIGSRIQKKQDHTAYQNFEYMKLGYWIFKPEKQTICRELHLRLSLKSGATIKEEIHSWLKQSLQSPEISGSTQFQSCRLYQRILPSSF